VSTPKRFEYVMWAAFGLFLASTLATAAAVLFACPFQFFGAGVVAMVGTGTGAVFARGLHEAHHLAAPVQRPQYLEMPDAAIWEARS
jgi:hypothetical protein